MTKNRLLIFGIFIILLVALKIDYRFIDEINCCGDDHDYFMHADTLANDFDFDYKNQMKGIEDKRFNQNGKIAPTGFLGSGLLAFPFLFIGVQINNLLSEFNDFENLYNFEILFYSFSTIFYLFLSILLLCKTLENKNNLLITIAVFGSGITYYAFERYSMTHIYELFTISLVLYTSKKFYNTNNQIFAFLIPIAIMLSFLVRWVNYFIVFIPFIISYYENQSKFKLIRSKHFIISSILSFGLFLWFSKQVYGIYTIDPQKIYGNIGIENTISTINFGELIAYLFDFLKINFSQEFGILWFNPPVFFAICYLIYDLSKNKKIINLVSLISFLSIYGIIILWGSTASSYGFRYIYATLPLAIYLIFKNDIFKSIFIKRVFIVLCLFSFTSTIFFETTTLTQLSLVENENIFGNNVRFTQPKYLSGFILSIANLESYLKIVSTSFLGAIFFKCVISLFGKISFINFLENLNLPVTNEDFLVLLDNLEKISYIKINLSIIFIILFLYFLNSKIITKN